MIHKFNTGVYDTDIYITYDATDKQLLNMFKVDPQYVTFDDTMDAYTYPTRTKKDNGQCILIRFLSKSYMTPAIMGHEATHSALQIFEYFQMDANGFKNEPLCYLI